MNGKVVAQLHFVALKYHLTTFHKQKNISFEKWIRMYFKDFKSYFVNHGWLISNMSSTQQAVLPLIRTGFGVHDYQQRVGKVSSWRIRSCPDDWDREMRVCLEGRRLSFSLFSDSWSSVSEWRPAEERLNRILWPEKESNFPDFCELASYAGKMRFWKCKS